jgi:hypothetical protein
MNALNIELIDFMHKSLDSPETGWVRLFGFCCKPVWTQGLTRPLPAHGGVDKQKK